MSTSHLCRSVSMSHALHLFGPMHAIVIQSFKTKQMEWRYTRWSAKLYAKKTMWRPFRIYYNSRALNDNHWSPHTKLCRVPFFHGLSCSCPQLFVLGLECVLIAPCLVTTHSCLVKEKMHGCGQSRIATRTSGPCGENWFRPLLWNSRYLRNVLFWETTTLSKVW